MLRISVLNEAGATRFKLEGKLAHEWVEEARKAWNALTGLVGNDVVVDLLGVSFVDDAGQQLLMAMRHGGARLIGTGPMMSALIGEIESAESARTEDAPQHEWRYRNHDNKGLDQ